VLDLGAGQGDGTSHLKALGAQVFHLDLAAEMIARGVARKIIAPGCSVINDFNRGFLPFKTESFDIIVARYVFHYLKNKGRLIQQLYELLKPGGRLQLVDVSGQGSRGVRFCNQIHRLKTHNGVRPCWIVTEQSLTGHLVNAGFPVVDSRWHFSRVNTRQWVKEGQISIKRHDELCELIKTSIAQYPALKRAFQVTVRKGCLELNLPILILNAVKRPGCLPG
jgi:SAM-dependent methyltransferase